MGAAVLAGVHLATRSPRPGDAGWRALDAEDTAIVAALVPVVLAGALPAERPARETAMREVVEAFDRTVSGLGPAVRGEIGDLLGLLRFAPARYALAGLAAPVAESSPQAIEAFLARWRTSRFDLLRASYQALTQLIQAAWYDNPSAWGAIGYPGPPALSAR